MYRGIKNTSSPSLSHRYFFFASFQNIRFPYGAAAESQNVCSSFVKSHLTSINFVCTFVWCFVVVVAKVCCCCVCVYVSMCGLGRGVLRNPSSVRHISNLADIVMLVHGVKTEGTVNTCARHGGQFTWQPRVSADRLRLRWC
jgi:hypothetical protein